MSHWITPEDWRRIAEEMKNLPPMTAEEKERYAELNRKMKSLSKEEWEAIHRKVMEEDPFL